MHSIEQARLSSENTEVVNREIWERPVLERLAAQEAQDGVNLFGADFLNKS